MDPTKKALYTDKRPSGLQTDTDSSLNDSVALFREGERNWLLSKIANGKQLILHGSGERGFRELVSSLTDDDVYFGAVKANVGGKAKVFHFGYVGPNTSGMKKGKATMQKNAAFSIIEAHGELFYTCELGEISEETVIRDIARLSTVTPADVELL